MPLLIRSGIDPWKGSRGPAQFEGQRIAAVKDELDQNAMPGVLEHAISAKISRLPRPHQCPTWELLRSDAGCELERVRSPISVALPRRPKVSFQSQWGTCVVLGTCAPELKLIAARRTDK